MYKKTMIASGIAMAVTALQVVADDHGEEGSFMDEWEISGELKNETAVFTNGGQTIGQATSTTDTTTKHDSGDVYKSESSAKIFVNGDVGEEGSSFHAELNLRYDSEGTSGYKGAKSYSQHDLLRELYVDTEVGDEDNPVSIRAGKQQVVWGTADGIKLLDMINPTDWREFAQNSMEDSRIPVWMVNAEADLESGGNIQAILSQAEENKIPGLGIASGSATSHNNGDQGHPFIMKGVDTITGKVNGFMNIGPALGKVATFFAGFPASDGTAATGAPALRSYTTTRVIDYVDDVTVQSSFDYNGGGAGNGVGSEGDFRGTCDESGVGGSGTYCESIDLNYVAQTTNTVTNNYSKAVTAGNNANVTNLIDSTDAVNDSSASNANWDTSNPNSMFEYMDQTAFATFAAFVDMETEYRTSSMPDNEGNFGLRFKNSNDEGMNYSFNYLYAYDPNPYIDLRWEDASDGTRLYVNEVDDYRKIGVEDSSVTSSTSGAYTITHVELYRDSALSTEQVFETHGASKLVFDQKMDRVSNLGAAFDYALDTDSAPVVLRGEFLYQDGVRTPVINLAKLRIGNITEAMKMEEADYFKYVIGADTTVMTNLMLSGQFIQMRNLDYIDETVNANSNNSTVTGARYTGDMASMHLTNGLQKAEKNKEFYSFFMSKPFGAEQQHRWNNIFMFEENGGKWNRFDVEYSFDDELIGLAEYNKYWGDANTQFGQMEKSSNFQLGLKYIF